MWTSLRMSMHASARTSAPSASLARKHCSGVSAPTVVGTSFPDRSARRRHSPRILPQGGGSSTQIAAGITNRPPAALRQRLSSPRQGLTPRPSPRPQPPTLRSHPAPDDLRECQPQAASHRPPALPHDPGLAARPTRQLPPRAPGQCGRPAGQGDEHRRHHAASGNVALALARGPGVAGQPVGAARGHREAQTHRDSQGQREGSQAREA
jgi:hypothetical protein